MELIPRLTLYLEIEGNWYRVAGPKELIYSLGWGFGGIVIDSQNGHATFGFCPMVERLHIEGPTINGFQVADFELVQLDPVPQWLEDPLYEDWAD